MRSTTTRSSRSSRCTRACSEDLKGSRIDDLTLVHAVVSYLDELRELSLRGNVLSDAGARLKINGD
jgi:hypothetical protein